MDIQASHELLLELLAKHPDFATRFKKREEPLSAPDVKDFDANETNAVAVLVATALNIRSGSVVGSHDLYSLMHTYLSVPSSRAGIDAAVRRAKEVVV
jgi:hypothetical protein